jgi:hypothetical protein
MEALYIERVIVCVLRGSATKGGKRVVDLRPRRRGRRVSGILCEDFASFMTTRLSRGRLNVRSGCEDFFTGRLIKVAGTAAQQRHEPALLEVLALRSG